MSLDLILVGAEGFEPPALCSQSRCATRLRYAPTLYDCSAACDRVAHGASAYLYRMLLWNRNCWDRRWPVTRL